jgi:glycosyltransferase involved in cell wall biosynthesis
MRSDSPRVSIIVPSYNAGPYLKFLCESIQSQTFQEFEVLIANDGSSDGTKEVLAAFRNDARFQILEWEQNRGVSAATLVLLSRIRGEYWCNPGADDILHPQFLEQRLALMTANPQAVLAHGPPEIIGSSGQLLANTGPYLDLPPVITGTRALSVLLQHNAVNTPSVFVRSGLTRLVLPFFDCTWRFAQDWYLWILHAATGFDLLWDPCPLHQYRLHEHSLTTRRDMDPVRRAEIRLVPLCALSAATQFSAQATHLWLLWRHALYALWLRRALNLARSSTLMPAWLERAAIAFRGRGCGYPSLLGEVSRCAVSVALSSWREAAARRRQAFTVSGLAEVDDPIFHRKKPYTPGLEDHR